MEPIAKIISKNVTWSRNHAMLENVLMALVTSNVTAPELDLKVDDVKTTLWIARSIHATGMEHALMESMTLAVTAKKVIKAKIVNTNPVPQNCVNMVVHAKTKQMVIIAIVFQALMVQIVRLRPLVSNS